MTLLSRTAIRSPDKWLHNQGKSPLSCKQASSCFRERGGKSGPGERDKGKVTQGDGVLPCELFLEKVVCRVLVCETHVLGVDTTRSNQETLCHPGTVQGTERREDGKSVNSGNGSWAFPRVQSRPQSNSASRHPVFRGGARFHGDHNFCSRAPSGTLGYLFSVLLKYRPSLNKTTVTLMLWGHTACCKRQGHRSTPNAGGPLARQRGKPAVRCVDAEGAPPGAKQKAKPRLSKDPQRYKSQQQQLAITEPLIYARHWVRAFCLLLPH